jgi:hypothetical protein
MYGDGKFIHAVVLPAPAMPKNNALNLLAANSGFLARNAILMISSID